MKSLKKQLEEVEIEIENLMQLGNNDEAINTKKRELQKKIWKSNYKII